MKKVVIIGCGNVAWHMARQLSALKKFRITVLNHRPHPRLIDFRKKLHLDIADKLENVPPDADYYLIAVSDKAIGEVGSRIKHLKKSALIIHTSGSAPVTEADPSASNTAVIYPLQTISRRDTFNWKEVPLIVEAKEERNRPELQKFAHIFSRKVYFRSGEERLKLHLAAVLVNNFPNALYAAAEGLLDQKKSRNDFNLLLPLISRTTEKLKALSPLAAQTGPARRGDTVAQKKHRNLLNQEKELKKIYKLMSRLIVKQQERYAEL